LATVPRFDTKLPATVVQGDQANDGLRLVALAISPDVIQSRFIPFVCWLRACLSLARALAWPRRCPLHQQRVQATVEWFAADHRHGWHGWRCHWAHFHASWFVGQ
jgi:hypothetical protein